MKHALLEKLRKNPNHISGEDLSRSFKISRSAIWKHIQELKKDGYDILAVPHLGYKLENSPDTLLPEEIQFDLRTTFIGKKVYFFETTTSTMDVAFNLGLDRASEGTVVCAEVQTKARGRLGRSWVSFKKKGIYFSVLLRPSLLPNETPKLTLLSAVAVVQAIKEITGLEAHIKWPNDILIDDKKVGGILTELDAETDAVKFVVIGIGINANVTKSAVPSHATSLKIECGREVSRVELTKEILRRIEALYIEFQKEGFHPIIERWRELSSTLGKRVRVTCHKEKVEGEALDVDMDGGLLIRKDSGFMEKIYTGDVTRLR
ncbi:biotin--[acetyl-CoA-carboxylase] ligase [Candidatus Omnitrophota bacterium]